MLLAGSDVAVSLT